MFSLKFTESFFRYGPRLGLLYVKIIPMFKVFQAKKSSGFRECDLFVHIPRIQTPAASSTATANKTSIAKCVHVFHYRHLIGPRHKPSLSMKGHVPFHPGPVQCNVNFTHSIVLLRRFCVFVVRFSHDIMKYVP